MNRLTKGQTKELNKLLHHARNLELQITTLLRGSEQTERFVFERIDMIVMRAVIIGMTGEKLEERERQEKERE